MKKRIMGLMLALVMMASLAVQAFAAVPDQESLQVSTTASGTVKDDNGNTYQMSGSSTKYSKGGMVVTSYRIKTYSGGDANADTSAKKTFSVSGSISFISADTYATMSNSNYNYGTSGSVSASKTDLLYLVSAVSGGHTLTTCGRSVTGYSTQT